MEELGGQARLLAIRNLDALELNCAKENAEETVEYVRSALHSDIPFVFSSDSHDHSEQPDTMWLKMARPDFNGVRQLVFEPELRISRAEPVEPEHSWIVGCMTTAGIYANVFFRFSPHLNVLIGGRGAGKSALIDLIRFAFETEPDDEHANRRFRDRIAGFLRGGGDVVVLISAADGNLYSVARAGSHVSSAATGPQFSERSAVYQLTDDASLPRDAELAEVMPVEFYGQGEVSRLADQVEHQLRLIDDNLDLQDLLSADERINASLDELETRMEDAASRIDELQGEIGRRPWLEEQVEALSKSLADPIFSSHDLWGKEREFLSALGAWVQGIADAMPPDLNEPVLPEVELDATPSKDLLRKAKSDADDGREKFNSGLTDMRAIASTASADVAAHRTRWEADFAKADSAYRAKLVEMGKADLEAVAAENRAMQAQIDKMVTSLEPELEEHRTKLADLRDARSRAFADLESLRRDMHSQRLSVAESLNGALEGSVRIDFSDAGDVAQYVEFLDQALTGSGMQSRPDKVAALAQSISPRNLALAIERGSDQALRAAGLSDGDSSKVKGAIGERARLQLERIATPALPEIKLRREGESIYSELGNLSVGEKCSAVLSIALLNRGRPLVIDQPEDDLDHAFVTQSIVESIRSVKHERQIIAATHNPNIPVLGDAETVFRVARMPGQDFCEIRVSGGLEIPSVTSEVQMLEGGAQAFERRRRRYGTG